MNVMIASNQWLSRPNDERYWTLAELYAAAVTQRDRANVAVLDGTRLEAKVSDGGIGIRAGMLDSMPPVSYPTHFAFDQLCARVGAPAEFLRGLPVELAAQCLNSKLGDRRDPVQIVTEGNTLRCVTGPRFPRVWSAEVVDRVLYPLQDLGWVVPPGFATPDCVDAGRSRPATPADCTPVSIIKPGDIIGPAGLYMGDRDFFAVMVHAGRSIADGGDGAYRAIIIRNSEVGAGKYEAIAFLLQVICGNHILWNARELGTVSLVHNGKRIVNEGSRLMLDAAKLWADQPAGPDEALITRARSMPVIPDLHTVPEGSRRERIATSLRNRGFGPLSLFNAAFDAAVDAGQDPCTVWGMVDGLTRLSQTGSGTKWAGSRLATDQVAKRILQLAS